jgi:peptidoglycan-associated lipoprotein
MNHAHYNKLFLVALLTAVFGLAGCSKKAAKVTPPAPPAPTPTATLAANPAVVPMGQSTTLTWSTQNATDITIDGLGTVPASGTRTLTPSASTTYNLMAKGPGGSADASARVTVNPAPATAAKSEMSLQDLFSRNVKDVFFDLDRYNLRPDDAPIATNDAAFLKQHPDVKVVLEGHCDDRGSEEYNLALGANRANAMKQALVSQGVSADRLKTISYGKEKPFCTSDDEQCWQQNRRDHVGMAQ